MNKVLTVFFFLFYLVLLLVIIENHTMAAMIMMAIGMFSQATVAMAQTFIKHS